MTIINEDPEITVIIVTKNRSKPLIKCLKSLNRSLYKNFEVIIVQQGNRESYKNYELATILNSIPRSTYTYDKRIGKSKGLNLAISMAKSPILAFTDDDCLPSKSWLKRIIESFHFDPNIIGVFGKTTPFNLHDNANLYCPSTLKGTKRTVISELVHHSSHIGYGNNMAFRRSAFEDNNLFIEVIGPGSIGCAAEDGEFALRLIYQGKKIMYNPKVIVNHNRWLTDYDNRVQQLSYLTGEVSLYGFFLLMRHKIGRQVIYSVMRDIYCDCKVLAKFVAKLNIYSLQLVIFLFLKIIAVSRGFLVAIYLYYYKMPIYYKKIILK